MDEATAASCSLTNGESPVTDRISAILAVVKKWAKAQNEIRGLALVGSRARNAACPDSDIDLILLVRDTQSFRDPAWLAAIDWSTARVRATRWSDEEYGAVWSRRMWLVPEGELELSFARTTWADTSPVDPGTARVVQDGCRILYDTDGLLERLIKAAIRLE
jgi:uncharacterized protein